MRLQSIMHNNFQTVGPEDAYLKSMQPSRSKVAVLIVAVSAAGAFSFWLGGQTVRPQNQIITNNAPSSSVESAENQLETLSQVVSQGMVKIALRGNGRERLVLGLRNRSRRCLSIQVPAGQMFRSAGTSVILLRSREIVLAEGGTERVTLQTAAVHAGGTVGEADFELSENTIPKLDALLGYLARHPEISTAAAQTAVLALIDNLPISAFAKFAPVGGEMPSILDTLAFRVDVEEIIRALLVLRDLGVPASRIALAVDPQLRIEAMIDPLAHAMAMSYYKIAPEREWDYWKWELCHGDEATRHYVLFGIARFFPDVAVGMLPKWVRETRTDPVYRMSALQALAETVRPEVLGILRQLVIELGTGTELGRTAQEAVQFVSMREGRNSGESTVAIAFRGGSTKL
jgi:hypothetical protein